MSAKLFIKYFICFTFLFNPFNTSFAQVDNVTDAILDLKLYEANVGSTNTPSPSPTTGLCQRKRTIQGKTTIERVFYAMSFEVDAKKFAKVSRNHWQVENNLHWVLDVVFAEDKQKYKDKTMAQNLSCLRKMVLNILKKDPRKASLQAKHLRAA